MSVLLVAGFWMQVASGSRMPQMEGMPANIASSAYQYRADRKPDANPPESWLALIHYAHLPLNKAVDPNNTTIKHVLTSLLWEEIRPVQYLELTWPVGAKNRPPSEQLEISALINRGASSSWWNNLDSVPQAITPAISNGGRTYTYAIAQNTCGLIVGVRGEKLATAYDMPEVRALVPDVWKKMDVEIEWGFSSDTVAKDYSGRLETYDGLASDMKPLPGPTSVLGGNAWRSKGKSTSRRGVKMSLLYMGISRWRKQMNYTTHPDDVARTIVTVWTKSGNFSFLAADLENGPIYAPEYGFFVRRTSPLVRNDKDASPRFAAVPLPGPMNAVVGNNELKGWGSDATPIFFTNPTDHPINAVGIYVPSKGVAMHPGSSVDVVTEWRSPIKGAVRVWAEMAHAQAGSNGIEWWIKRSNRTSEKVLAHGETSGTGSQAVPIGKDQSDNLKAVEVEPGDVLSLVIGPKGDYRCDTTLVNWTIAEVGGNSRIWNLFRDVASNPLAGNPHPDSLGNTGVWRFCSAMPMSASEPSAPPIELASKATNAKDFVKELKARGLKTIRQQTRARKEQTWEGAVTAMRGPNVPPHPTPPPGTEPPMQVDVPSERFNAQWKLGAWHLLRHCAKNPANGKLWFNDFPYGILGAETYLILDTLDLMGCHDAAADGYDQWLSMPREREHPVGNFADGLGVLSNAVGPDGYGGNMDTVHAFGPGSIGWGLTQHYALTQDLTWGMNSLNRTLDNALWILRQRQVVSDMVPGGERLWCKGLQPALQVTPDSGGLWMQFYECEAYYWAAVSRLAQVAGVKESMLQQDAEAYRHDLKAAVERSIALSPVVPVRDGTFHSVVPFACYCRGLSTGAWGWQREGSREHVGPLYWDSVQSAAALISPAGLLPADDVRVQGYLDVLEDRVLLENQNAQTHGAAQDWFNGGWQYQGGLERTANMHLAGDDIPVFLRSFFNCYAVDILEKEGYTFNEHAVHGPPDKIFEEAAFLERFRNLLVMEEGEHLWLAKGTPREWLEQGKHITVKNAPTYLGTIAYEIRSDVDHGRISASITMPRQPGDVWLRLRHPQSVPMKKVTVNGKLWKEFDPAKEVIRLYSIGGEARIEVRY